MGGLVRQKRQKEINQKSRDLQVEKKAMRNEAAAAGGGAGESGGGTALTFFNITTPSSRHRSLVDSRETRPGAGGSPEDSIKNRSSRERSVSRVHRRRYTAPAFLSRVKRQTHVGNTTDEKKEKRGRR